MLPDPFGTAGLRAAVIAAWAGSPTRFREDANAEEDLLLGGYADRWLVELAQNAADAARRSGEPGRLLVRVAAAGELRVANTGTPLDADGVAALASLRASTKRDDDAVGRFGVGFAAVLGVSTEPVIVSADGGVRFSARDTCAEVAALPGAAPAELARRRGRPPVLRLPWPVADERPPAGYDTEVRLPLTGASVTGPPMAGGASGGAAASGDARASAGGASGGAAASGDARAAAGGASPEALIAAAEMAAPELLLALPWLVEITVVGAGGRPTVHRRHDRDDGTLTLEPGGRHWLLVRREGLLTSGVAAVEDRVDWSVCWALPLDAAGRPDPLTEDVLHAPTPSDERLALPARLIATFPMEPSRRRIRTGDAADEVVRAAASAYLDLVLAVPADARAALAPTPDFPRGELDAAVRAAVTEALAGAAWLPSARRGGLLKPGEARLLDPPGSPELAELLADAVPELLADSVRAAPRAALTALGVRPFGLAELADRLAAVRLPPHRWRDLYTGLAAAADGVPDARDELAALPVPLADGRTVTGPRGALLLDGDPDWASRVTGRLAGLDLPGVRIVHLEAAHPLLSILGAITAGPAGLLDHPGVVEAVHRSGDEDADDAFSEPDDEGSNGWAANGESSDGRTVAAGGTGLARFVLDLVAEIGPSSYDGPPTRPWLAALALPDADGELRRADELMLPDAAIRPLLAKDSPLTVLDAGLARAFPRAVLTEVGVLDAFAVVADEDPAGPDHDLADEDDWWDQLDDAPNRLLAVRDLDLVDDDCWPAALTQLAAAPRTRAALFAEPSYTAWWLARHARLAGRRPGYWRLGSATGLAGLFDPVPELGVPELGVPEEVLATVGVRRDLIVRDREDAAELLTRLGDPARQPDAALTHRAHTELAAAVLADRFDPADVDPPERLRSVAGSVLGSDRAVLLDRPWLAPVLDPADAVSGLLGDPEQTDALAELLDLPLASELVSARVTSQGRPVRWSTILEVVVTCANIGVEVPDGVLHLHEELTVELTRPTRTTATVPAWHDTGGWHATDPLRALLARLAAPTRDPRP